MNFAKIMMMMQGADSLLQFDKNRMLHAASANFPRHLSQAKCLTGGYLLFSCSKRLDRGPRFVTAALSSP